MIKEKLVVGSAGLPFCNTRENQGQHEGRERDEKRRSHGRHLRGKILVDTQQEKACRGQGFIVSVTMKNGDPEDLLRSTVFVS